MAVNAMAHTTKFDNKELLALQKEFKTLASKSGNPYTINSKELQQALELVGIEESDKAILERIFTLLDVTGDDQINFREFVVGLAPLCKGDLADKLNFSFTLYDLDATGQIKPEEMAFVLNSMNNTCSFFGDKTLTKKEIDDLVAEIFDRADVSHTGTLSYSEYMTAVAEHPILVEFITKNG